MGQACLTIEESQNRSHKSIKLKPNPLLNLLQKAWLNETDSLVLGRLTERIGMFLNLNVSSRYHMIYLYIYIYIEREIFIFTIS